MKVCKKCNQSKPLDSFPCEAKRKDGRYPWCRVCLSVHRRDRYVQRSRAVFITNKVCSRCQRDLPREKFRKYEGANLHYRCIDCEDEIAYHRAEGRDQCGSCKTWKPLTDFYPSKRHRHRSQCIACGVKYHVDNKDAIRSRSLQKFYGITLEQYKELIAKQNGACPVCSEKLEPGNYSYPVDHAHKGKFKGRIRGIVHDECNRFVLWTHEDSSILRAAANLIDNPLTDWVVPEKWVNGVKWPSP